MKDRKIPFYRRSCVCWSVWANTERCQSWTEWLRPSITSHKFGCRKCHSATLRPISVVRRRQSLWL